MPAATTRLLAVLLLLLPVSCRSTDAPVLTVLAAASLHGAFGEVGRAFEAAHPGARVALSFAGSQQIARQVGLGAPADVVAVAADAPMRAMIASGRVVAAAVRPFAANRLALALAPGNPGRVRVAADLARPGLRLSMAAPEVPLGAATGAFLRRAAAVYRPAFAGAVRAAVVSLEPDARQVLARVSLGEVDAGFVYASDLAAGRLPQVALPEALNPEVVYPMAPLADAPHPRLAAVFVAFVRSEAGQAILARHGFLPVS